MFGLHPNEIAFTVLLAVLIFGPKKLPELARGMGQAIREFRQVTAEPFEERPAASSSAREAEPPVASDEGRQAPG